MKRHFFIDKSATIIKGSRANTGLNPILSINYGATITRGLIHFNEKDIFDNWIKKDGLDISKMKFTLYLTNCLSVNSVLPEEPLVSTPGSTSHRACSFDIDVFKIEQEFDAGRGYDYVSDTWAENKRSYSEAGVNWTNARTASKWKLEGAYGSRNIIAKKHFDFGKENLEVDITDYVKSIYNGEKNCGLGIKFSDEYEIMESADQYYVGFFTDNTNTYFHPFIEATYESIEDSRDNFVSGKKNKLYLYAISNGEKVSFDKMPICKISGKEYPVKKYSNGIYYAEIAEDINKGMSDVILYDEWTNLLIDGIDAGKIENEFVAHPSKNIASIGTNPSTVKVNTVPVIYGIDNGEDIIIGDVRELTVDFREKYSTNKKEISTTSSYRLYVKDAHREITIMEGNVEHAFLNNFIVINTLDLIPHEYFIDIKTYSCNETRVYKDILKFNVVSDITERYF